MTVLKAAILAALGALPRPWGEPGRPDDVIAAAIDSATLAATCSGPWANWEGGCSRSWPGTRRDGARLLLVVGYHESAFAERIQAGQCKKLECDPVWVDGKRRQQAASYWQFHVSGFVQPEMWRRSIGAGYEQTTLAAFLALRVLGSGMRKCGTVQGALAVYAGRGADCKWRGKGTEKRLATYERLRRRI